MSGAATAVVLGGRMGAAENGALRLLDDEGEARLCWRLRGWMARTLLHQALTTGRLRLLVLVLFSAVFWASLFLLFAEGFALVRENLPFEGQRVETVQAIFNLFFLAITVMVGFSAGIILYGGLFASEETAFLLTTPLSCRRIVLYRFQETVFFACWGFLLLGTPMLIAYGVENAAPWYYYALMVPFMVSFVLIPAAWGSIACLLVVRYLPWARMHAAAAAILLVIAAAGVWGWYAFGGRYYDLMTPARFQQILDRLRFAEQRLAPHWWMSSGLLEAAHPTHVVDRFPSWQESLLFLSVLVTNALLFQMALAALGGVTLRSSYSRLQESLSPRRRAGDSWLDRLTLGLLRPLPLHLRLLLLNDVRICRRDPVQWSQFVIFFSLLALYFTNIRRFHYGETLQQWITVIGFMNLGVVALILATFTTRFVFPLLSQEARRFWILGTLPISRDSILWSKFLFACAGSYLPCATLVLLSDLLLQIQSRTPLIAGAHQVVCAAICAALAGLAVGLGARFPTLYEASPSKIAAGFGGTLNLVLSTILILAVMIVVGSPCYYWVEAHADARMQLAAPPAWGPLALIPWGSDLSIWLGVAVAILLCALAAIVPMRMGLIAFRRLEA